jgi:hypothetical protein
MGVQNLSADEQTELIRKYNSCVGKLNVKKGHNPPKLEDQLQVMKEWSPKTDWIPFWELYCSGKSQTTINQMAIRLEVDCKS